MSASTPTFSDRPKAVSTPKLRALVKFPGNVQATTGINVEKVSGTWTFALDFGDFATTTTVPESLTNCVLSYDTTANNYILVPTSLFAGSGGGGGGALPATATPLMNGTAAVGIATKYAREDHIHPSDTSRAPVASPALTGTPTTPTATAGTNTTQIASTAFVQAAVTASGGVTPSALTGVDDTNVILTLGGTPATALLQATSITAGWTGTLSAARGGFGLSVSASSGVPLFASGVPTFTATTGTGNFVRAADPALTGNPTAPTPTAGDNDTSIATTAFVTNAVSSKASTTYVDTQDALKVALAGDTMTGVLKLGSTNTGPGFGNTIAGCAIHPVGQIYSSSASGYACNLNSNIDTFVQTFLRSGNIVGSVAVTTTGTAYNTTSDQRLKEDLKSFDSGNIIDDTKVYDFAWKTTGERSYGVLAQQAVEVYPQAIDHNVEHDWWGVDYSRYTPVILQELKALRARVAELEVSAGLRPQPPKPTTAKTAPKRKKK